MSLDSGPQWDSEKLYLETGAFFADVVKDIENAKKSIDIEMYIFSNDSRGRLIADKLVQASQRGVKVRLLIDGVGSILSLNHFVEFFKKTEVQVRNYNSIFWFNLFHLFSGGNLRNHRKSWIIDEETIYVSSGNVTDNDWKEVGVRVSGSDTWLLRQAFEKAWKQKRFLIQRPKIRDLLRQIRLNRPHLIRLNHSWSLRIVNFHGFLRKIKRARTRVWLGNAYFVPRYSLVRALMRAAHRGRDVRLLLPSESDVFFMPWLSSTYYYGLIRAGVRIYEYKPSFYHAKVRVIDDWMLVGSSNLNHRSQFLDLEVDIRLTHKESQRALVNDITKDFANSRLLTIADLNNISLFKRIFAKMMLFFRYWL